MKRFMLFVGRDDYPSGGMYDFHKDYSSIDEAKANGDNLITGARYEIDNNDWYHIFDLEKNEMVNLKKYINE